MKPLVAKTTLVALKDLKCKRLEDDYREHPDDDSMEFSHEALSEIKWGIK